MKKLILSVIILPLIFSSCATGAHFISTDFKPQASEGVTVRMIDGTYVPSIIAYGRFHINVHFKDKPADGTVDFFVTIVNDSAEFKIISRFDDFKLIAYKNDNVTKYVPFSFDKWIDKDFHRRWSRERSDSSVEMYQVYQYWKKAYYKENDISPRPKAEIRDADVYGGIISFPYDNFDRFDFIINVKMENRQGELTVDTYTIHFTRS